MGCCASKSGKAVLVLTGRPIQQNKHKHETISVVNNTISTRKTQNTINVNEYNNQATSIVHNHEGNQNNYDITTGPERPALVYKEGDKGPITLTDTTIVNNYTSSTNHLHNHNTTVQRNEYNVLPQQDRVEQPKAENYNQNEVNVQQNILVDIRTQGHENRGSNNGQDENQSNNDKPTSSTNVSRIDEIPNCHVEYLPTSKHLTKQQREEAAPDANKVTRNPDDSNCTSSETSDINDTAEKHTPSGKEISRHTSVVRTASTQHESDFNDFETENNVTRSRHTSFVRTYSTQDESDFNGLRTESNRSNVSSRAISHSSDIEEIAKQMNSISSENEGKECLPDRNGSFAGGNASKTDTLPTEIVTANYENDDEILPKQNELSHHRSAKDECVSGSMEPDTEWSDIKTMPQQATESELIGRTTVEEIEPLPKHTHLDNANPLTAEELPLQQEVVLVKTEVENRQPSTAQESSNTVDETMCLFDQQVKNIPDQFNRDALRDENDFMEDMLLNKDKLTKEEFHDLLLKYYEGLSRHLARRNEELDNIQDQSTENDIISDPGDNESYDYDSDDFEDYSGSDAESGTEPDSDAKSINDNETTTSDIEINSSDRDISTQTVEQLSTEIKTMDEEFTEKVLTKRNQITEDDFRRLEEEHNKATSRIMENKKKEISDHKRRLSEKLKNLRRSGKNLNDHYSSSDSENEDMIATQLDQFSENDLFIGIPPLHIEYEHDLQRQLTERREKIREIFENDTDKLLKECDKTAEKLSVLQETTSSDFEINTSDRDISTQTVEQLSTEIKIMDEEFSNKVFTKRSQITEDDFKRLEEEHNKATSRIMENKKKEISDHKRRLSEKLKNLRRSGKNTNEHYTSSDSENEDLITTKVDQFSENNLLIGLPPLRIEYKHDLQRQLTERREKIREIFEKKTGKLLKECDKTAEKLSVLKENIDNSTQISDHDNEKSGEKNMSRDNADENDFPDIRFEHLNDEEAFKKLLGEYRTRQQHVVEINAKKKIENHDKLNEKLRQRRNNKQSAPEIDHDSSGANKTRRVKPRKKKIDRHEYEQVKLEHDETKLKFKERKELAKSEHGDKVQEKLQTKLHKKRKAKELKQSVAPGMSRKNSDKTRLLASL